MMDYSSDLSIFFQKYRVTSIEEKEQLQYYEYSRPFGVTSYELDEHLRKKSDRVVTVTMSESGLKELMALSAEREAECNLRRIPQVRDAYERYKVIENLYKRHI